jgi:GMP synthase-like glutamine amidotransferase
MTRTLIVNCSLENVENKVLRDAISKFSDYKVIHFREIDAGYQIDKHIDAVVLSGSAARIVYDFHRAMFEGTVDLIKKCTQPILGICFGHQLLCWANGAKVSSLSQPVLDKFEKINVITDNELFAGFTQPILAENHNDYVLKESLDEAGFILLADSPSCKVEAVKYRIKPFYGVQFHPEKIMVKDESHADGHRIIENFYENVVKK